MKVVYKGHEIDVRRERCMGGWSQLYYSIFRVSDGHECTSGHTEDTSPVRTYVGYMKERVDAELAETAPWGEKSDEEGIASPYCDCNSDDSADEEELFANRCKACGGQLV